MFQLNERDYGSKFFLVGVSLGMPWLAYWYTQAFGHVSFDWERFGQVGMFVMFQYLLHHALPAKVVCGPVSPAGNIHTYHLNAKFWMSATVALWLAYGKWVNHHALVVFSREFSHFFWPLFAWALTVFCLFTLYTTCYPTNSDAVASQSRLVDLISGRELSPRIFGRDFKLFWIGVSMQLWLLKTLSNVFVAHQDQHNVLTTTALAAMQIVYIVDWALCEEWYVRSTIDIIQDRFGFILCVLPFVVIPTFYTSFTSYAAHSSLSPQLDETKTGAAILLFLLAYMAFRRCNNLKFLAKKSTLFSVRKLLVPTFLCVDGGWGLARHFNYFTDLVMCFSMSLAVFQPGHVSTWPDVTAHAYFLLMIFILVNRERRDDVKCQLKYGDGWTYYRQLVPWRIIPYIY